MRDKRTFFEKQVDIGKIFSNYFLHHVGDKVGKTASKFVLVKGLVFFQSQSFLSSFLRVKFQKILSI